MSNVPQHLIDEATRRGIVPGVTIKSVKASDHCEGEVGPYDAWDLGCAGSLIVAPYPLLMYAWDEIGKEWATVITPAPSQQPQAIGLQEGDAVECGPAMRAAIIDLAKELDVLVYEGDGGSSTQYPNLMWIGSSTQYPNLMWRGSRSYLIGSCSSRSDKDKNWHTPEAFIAKMRVTASQPKPIKIGGNTVEFAKGEIKVGCTTISNETVRAVAAKLID